MWKIFTKLWRTFPLSNIKIAVGSYTADYLWFHLLRCLGDFNQEEKKSFLNTYFSDEVGKDNS